MKKYFLAIAFLFVCAPAAHASVIPKAPNNLGLVGYWSFNEGTGTVANDYSGKGNDGTTTSTTWTTGKFGNSLSFNGSSSYVGMSNAVAPATGYTVSAWVNINTSPVGAYAIYDLGVKSGCNPSSQEFRIQSLKLRYAVGCGGSLVSTTTIVANTWYFVTLTVDANKLASLYVNGVLDTGPTDESSGQSLASGNDLIGAAYSAGAITHYFPGKIDEVRVYNRVLSATEIAALYKAGTSRIGAPVNPGTLGTGLVGWWTMDGADIGSSFVDRSGNGFNGYLTGTNNATSSRKTVGKVGQAFTFGGMSTGGINLGSSASLDPNRFTIAGWIYVNTPQTYNYNYIYSNARDCCGTYNGIELKVTEPGVLNALIWNSSASTLNSNSFIATSTWTYVAYTYNGATMKVYINGKLDNSKTQTTDPGTPASFNTYLGSMGNGSGASFTLNGKLDDMRLYNRALSASEIQTLYNLTAGTHANTSSASLDNGSSLSSGLVGLWTFDGKDMYQNVADESGQGNVGYLVGFTSTSSALTIGKLGQALQFGGPNGSSLVNLGTGNLGITTTMIVSAWVKTTYAGSNYTGIIGKSNSSAGSWKMDMTNAGKARIDIFSGPTTYSDVVGGTSINDGKWHLVTAEYDGANMSIYVDGVLVGGPTAFSGGVNSSTAPLQIGNDNCCGSGRIFPGAIDDVRIYNRVLSAAEIKQLYTMGK